LKSGAPPHYFTKEVLERGFAILESQGRRGFLVT